MSLKFQRNPCCVFIKALLIFLLIKQHYTTHSSNLMEHTWTNTQSSRERGGRERVQREEKGGKVRVFVSGSGLTGGGTDPVGGSVALYGTAWHGANLQWTFKCKGGEERSETCVGVLSEILLPNDVEAAQGRLIMAVRDVSDKIFPEERVELQG